MIVSINGRLVPQDEARIDPRDRGFTLGDALYETIRIRDGEPLRLGRHFSRLQSGLRLLGFPAPVDEAAVAETIRAVLAANGLGDAAVRVTVSRGPAARGIAPDPAARPTIVVGAASFAAPGPLTAMIATVTRRNEHSPLARIKSTNCLDSILAKIEAGQRGADEALLLNGAGRLAEGTASNLFAVIDGALLTPPIADGALPGVMRAELIDRLGAVEHPLQPADLARAAELFLTSSLGVRPVTMLDGRAIPQGPASARAAELA
jgi:branched-chain amino acid aminotransferase